MSPFCNLTLDWNLGCSLGKWFGSWNTTAYAYLIIVEDGVTVKVYDKPSA